MSIRKRVWKNKDGSEGEAWVLAYTDASGKRRLKSFKRKADAQRHATKVSTELAAGTHVPHRMSILLSEAAELWYRGCEARGLVRSTLENYAATKKKIITHIGGLKLSQLSAAVVLDFKDKVATEPWTDAVGNMWPGSLQQAERVFWSLGAILADAMGRGLVGQNVVYNLQAQRRGKRSDQGVATTARADSRADPEAEADQRDGRCFRSRQGCHSGSSTPVD
jgi:integrase